MFDIVTLFERALKNEKNGELATLILNNILDFGSEFITISTYSEGKIIFINDSFVKTIGREKSDFVGHTVDKLSVWENPVKRIEMLQILKHQGIVENFEVNFKDHAGQVCTYLLSCKPINVLGIYCIITVGWDITRRRELEDQLHVALKNDLRQTVQSLDNLVFKLMLGQDGQLTYVMSEGKIAQSMGLTTDAVYGKTAVEMFPSEVSDVVEANILKALNGEAVSYEIEVADRTMMKSLSPYYERGKITGIVGSAIDITERKKLEKMLQTSELNSALGQLAAGAAHEIRNPLTAIQGFVQLIGEILENNKIEKGGMYVELILSELARINHLVGEMLWLRKPKESVYEVLNVSRLLQEVLPLVYVEANLKSIVVSLQLNSNSPNIRGNPDLLKQVMLNICKNGIEAMDDGGSLEISEKYFDNAMTILIKDTGPGIPQEIQDQIFTPFFTTKSKGTGLGLFICKQILHDMDGDIAISSDGTGTVVSIRFPLWPGN